MNGELKYMVVEEPFINKALALAEAIGKFKTSEMELEFAKVLRKASTPPLMVSPVRPEKESE